MNTQQTRPLWGGSQLTEVGCVGAGRGHPPPLGLCEGPSCQRKSRGAGVSARSTPAGPHPERRKLPGFKDVL